MLELSQLREVDVPPLDAGRLRSLIGQERYDRLVTAAQRTRAYLQGGTVWSVNSTAAGGGVAEMLRVLVGYARGLGLSARWLVMSAEAPFFSVTKRLHNRLHGAPGDDGPLGAAEALVYESVTAANAAAMSSQVRAGDVVLLHDPQTAGMVGPLKDAGVTVLWRCHIGSDTTNRWTEEAWGFLRPHLVGCDGFVFTRPAYVPGWVDGERVAIIPPSIDPFSPKNQDLPAASCRSILATLGVVDGPRGADARFTRRDGSEGAVTRRAAMVADGPLDADARLVVQVSRWDRLKDMPGVMTGFSDVVAGRSDAQLALVGPAVADVADDPEGGDVLRQCVDLWDGLPPSRRRRIRLITLPMDDIDENAAMVNALQRHASLVVQKSLAEGFGLTVAEAMWKSKAVVASAVGGIVDQVAPGTGVLLDDPTDLLAFGESLVTLLDHPEEVAQMGGNARRHVVDCFVGDEHLLRYSELIERVHKS
ncbi:MAG TPA: glycosyltransferase [Acidimicrobiales bacterium]|nr:glycosyltransferase [Acidimicrobiales bacterium]